MGTVGYCAPRVSKDRLKTLVKQAETRIKDPKKYSELVDPLLDGHYPRASLSQVLAIAAMCLSTDASVRPSISDVVAALDSLVQDPIPSK
ncbi:putative non-specific serine/threonine protein kinase [Helianthus annuus]|nr:putative non-specific serine/threonine protein kinase [Helianthus annuus]